MKKSLLLSAIMLLAVMAGHAQTEQREPAGKRFPTVPPFTLLSPDSSSFSRDDLPKHKSTMIMYFSPDCDHCKHQTDEMLKNMDRLKDVQIVMTTYQPFEEMVAFYKAREMQRYPNIRMGRDTKFFFVPFYEINEMPYLALYDSKGQLIQTFEGSTGIDKVINAFKKKAKN